MNKFLPEFRVGLSAIPCFLHRFFTLFRLPEPMSSVSDLFAQSHPVPLAEALRPATLDEVIGQRHLLGPGKPLRLAFEARKLHSLILWGPPGVGKTTLSMSSSGFSPSSRMEVSMTGDGRPSGSAASPPRRREPPPLTQRQRCPPRPCPADEHQGVQHCLRRLTMTEQQLQAVQHCSTPPVQHCLRKPPR